MSTIKTTLFTILGVAFKSHVLFHTEYFTIGNISPHSCPAENKGDQLTINFTRISFTLKVDSDSNLSDPTE